jgi:hypothetical protein
VSRTWKSVVLSLVVLALFLNASAWADRFPGGMRESLGPQFNAAPQLFEAPRRQITGRGVGSVSRLRHWNEIAINASGLDHTPVRPGEDRVFGEQLGPGRSSRAMAIMHIAIFDAVNAIAGRYESYTGLRPARRATSMDAAIAQAAHDALGALFPSQTARLDAQLAKDLQRIRPRHGPAKQNGIKLGQQAPAAILALRADDGTQHEEPHMGVDYIPSNRPSK